MSRRRGSLVELAASIAVIAGILYVTRSFYPLHWSVTYSLCVIYATNLCHFLAMPGQRKYDDDAVIW